MRKEKNIIYIFALLAVLTLLLTTLASAEFWQCFERAEKINYCNPKTPDRTCGNTIGCMYCMGSFNEAEGCYNQGNFNVCNGITPQCSLSSGGGQIDAEPPILTILRPIQDNIYSEKSILLHFTLDERADVSYIDLIKPKARPKKICGKCSSYERKRSFEEGLNNLMFIAADVVGNTAYQNISFFIDSRAPRINKVLPKRGFASGMFEVQFTEANPESLELNYGNQETGFLTQSVDIENSCSLEKGKYNCETSVDLSPYDGEEIEYHFDLTDIAGSSDSSKPVTLKVDATSPIINSLNYEFNDRRVNFLIDITEENFDKIEYIDNSDPRARWRILCSRLKEGICEKSITLQEGNHDLDVKVSDEAGNSVNQNLDITI